MTITYEEFERVDLRCGTIVKAEKFLRATKPAYKIWADFGSEIGILHTSAQITVHYTPQTLLGKKNCRLCKFRREEYSRICL